MRVLYEGLYLQVMAFRFLGLCLWLVVDTNVVLWVTGYVSLSYGLKLCGVQIYLLASFSVLWPHFASATVPSFPRVTI